MNNTIFVQIASYKDPELFNTMNDMISNAKYPEALHIGVAWQHGDERDEARHDRGRLRVAHSPLCQQGGYHKDRYPHGQVRRPRGQEVSHGGPGSARHSR